MSEYQSPRFELTRYPLAVRFGNAGGETWYSHVIAVRISDYGRTIEAALDDGTIVRIGPNARLEPKP